MSRIYLDWNATAPMRQVISAEAVASVVLAQVTSGLVTGEVWVVDAGMHLTR